MKIIGWTPECASRLAEHIRLLVQSTAVSPSKDVVVARRTNCLPVYAGWTGSIVVCESGEMKFYDSEYDTIKPLEDEAWASVAITYLAKKCPDLAFLVPAMPSSASTCPLCGGKGFLLNDAFVCGNCGGYGWDDA